MFPVFTSPLGSRKAIFESRVLDAPNEPSTSTMDPALGVLKSFRFKAVSVPTGLTDAAGSVVIFVRTRSAQDFGGALAGGDDEVDACAGSGRPASAPDDKDGDAACSGVAGASLAAPNFVDADVALAETLWPALGMFGSCGITGTIGINGTAGLSLGFACAAADAAGCVCEGTGGGTAEDGVVARVESASDGAWEVTGVSLSDLASAGGGGSVGGTMFSSVFVSSCSFRDGSSTGARGDCGPFRFRRR